MFRKSFIVVSILVLSILTLSACNLPERQVNQDGSSSSITATNPEISPTAVSICNNPYFPSQLGNTWQYSGSNTASGAYDRSDTVSRSSANSFGVDTTLAGITFGVNYSCSSAGLTANDPIQQYAGALLSNPDLPVNIKLTSVSGITLPANIVPGDTWQQTADFEASSQQVNMNGRFVMDYTAVGYENVTVPAGSFNAIRVDTTIRIRGERVPCRSRHVHRIHLVGSRRWNG